MLPATAKVNLSLYALPSLSVNQGSLLLGSGGSGSGSTMSGRPGDRMDRPVIFTSGSSVSAVWLVPNHEVNLEREFAQMFASSGRMES